MGYGIFIASALAATVGAGVGMEIVRREVHKLRLKLKEKEDSVARTSKLLIEKNIELFDENIRQQKQLASKDDFLAIASHQLRTPVAEVKWAVGALLTQPADQPVARPDLERIAGSAAKMERLIEDLLQFVTVEQDRSRTAVSPYEPDSIVTTVVERIKKDFTKRSVSISTSLAYGGTLQSLGQSGLDMTLSNLIENAYLYTSDGGSIAVRTLRHTDGSLVIEVEDTGMGVTEDMRERLFVKFRRGAAAQERNGEGSGLGLYIVKTIIERAGGSVAYRPRIVEGQPDQGSIFSFSLPAVAAKAPSRMP